MKTPLEILRVKGPDGTTQFKAIISFEDAIGDTSQSKKLIQIQNAYALYVDKLRKLWKKIESNRKNMADSIMQWKLANAIFSFVESVENEGYTFSNVTEALVRDVGMSRSQLNYLRKFRKRYPSIDKVSKEINWSKYREIMDIKSAEIRKICEEKILSGELKTDSEIRKFKKSHKMQKNSPQ